jgi:methyltransferase (TIGR00027 family)
MEKITSPLRDSVAETLYITLYMKYLETQKSNGILKDPKARELVEKIEYDFSKFKNGSKSAIGVAIRARHFDQKVAQFIKKRKNPIVVLLGCGLDTRYYRVQDKQSAVFYELDLPEVIHLREGLLPQEPNDILLEASILETDWMDYLKQQHPEGSFIFIIEGVLMYFDVETVKNVFTELAKRFRGSELHFDVVNEWMSRNSHIHDTVKHTNATFKFGTDNDRLFEDWAGNLRYISTLLYGDVKEWRRLFFQGLIMKLIPRFKYAGRMLEYRID